MCHGAVYHVAGRLFPDDDNARYAQLYLYDHGEALGRRVIQYPDLGKQTLQSWQAMLEGQSPYARQYRFMRDVATANNAPTVTLGFQCAKGSDVSRYSAPTTLEAGAGGGRLATGGWRLLGCRLLTAGGFTGEPGAAEADIIL